MANKKNSGRNKLRTYKLFKTNFTLEPYLTKVKCTQHRKALCQLRVSSHQLNIETLRGKIKDPSLRLCEQCTLAKTEDEMHFLMECHHYKDLRANALREISHSQSNFQYLDHINQFIWLMSNEDTAICKSIGKFIYEAFTKRKKALTAVTTLSSSI